ncbi:hypothetical protein ACVI1J_004763 [Bradyrhizobium diazoefficiens]
MAPKHHPTPLSGGDRKALAKELGRARPRGSLQIPPGVVSQIPPPARQDKGLLV